MTFADFIDFFLHAERHLEWFIQNYKIWIYALLFSIAFCETGLIVTPFLPGDSLLFAVGAIAGKGLIQVENVTPLMLVAAILGDAVNYSIGKWMGPKVFHYESSWFFNKAHLMKAHAFYEKYGGRAIILARFVPIVRTFAPFVAGVGSMTYSKFALYNVTGAILWVGIFVGGGFYFGGLEIVQKEHETRHSRDHNCLHPPDRLGIRQGLAREPQKSRLSPVQILGVPVTFTATLRTWRDRRCSNK